MIIVSWTIVFLFGLGIINAGAKEIKLLEKLGFALPIGLGIGTLLLFGFDLVGLPMNSYSLFIGSLAGLTLATHALAIPYYRTWFAELKNREKFSIKQLWPINFGWLVLMACITVVVHTIVSKTVFWPVFIHDSVNGYDFLARVIHVEGTFNNSIFDPSYPMYSVRSLYPPFTPLSFSISYLFENESSKIINAIFYTSNALVFYSFLSRYSGHLAAALFSFLLLITPEFAAFSALSSPNPICTFYSGMGMICLYIWYKDNLNAYFIVGLLCILLAVWTRSEAVMFVVGGGFIALIKAIKDRTVTKLLIFGVSCAAVFLFWQLYLKFGLKVEGSDDVIKHLYWDYDKLVRLMGKVKSVTFNMQYYGMLVHLFVAMVVVNAYFSLKHKEGLVLLSAVFVPWLVYIFIYYQLDDPYMPTGGTDYIQSGYKRGIFYFFPIMLFYCANNRVAYTIFNKWLKL